MFKDTKYQTQMSNDDVTVVPSNGIPINASTGNQPGSKKQPITNALRVRLGLPLPDEDCQRLNLLAGSNYADSFAAALLTLAVEGHVGAMALILDRIEGLPV